ncbi:hypothetical protein LX73_0976 [Fodinibius salinus]|uniref:Uncharacterized protein n=1 Tax=Fodinibius salinus TaxID=860790 RepID=A0A5D3YSW3_9BACT|nr:hypothetical protein [Fodinibius salinus]TYP95661.1 hypothetical protein LX73_0976 [Fodinibius salinus]
MNLGLTTSFIIAGLLLISILTMNINLSQSSTKLTVRQITNQKTNTVSKILQKDIGNIGYSSSGSISSSIKDAQSDYIKFETDIDNNGSVETIEWTFTSTDASNTQNPDDKVLIRSVDGNQTKIKSGITRFELTYYDKDRNEISYSAIASLLGGGQAERDKIRYIDVSLTVESTEKVGGANSTDSEYIKVYWNNQFSPPNLRL